MNKIEKAIIKTLAFYDILNRPLTLDEIWHQLFRLKASKLPVFIGLKSLMEKKLIIQKVSPKNNLYYAFFERSKIIEEYFAHFDVSLKRWQKVRGILKVLKLVPFIKMIAVINSLSYNNSREDSDIDILLVTKKGRLWTARALTILFLEIIGQNKNQWYEAGKFCLGFAFDESQLDLAKIKFSEDIDFTYWLANLIPVYDAGIYKNLIEANLWLKKELPNWQGMELAPKNGESRIKKMAEKVLAGKTGDRLESYLAKIQINRIWGDRQNKRSGASVIATETMMKLHPFDARKVRQKEWNKALTKFPKMR